MGNAAATSAGEESGGGVGDEFAEFDGIETLGYRVLGVQPNSPASKAGLVSFFDFLVGANGEMLLGSGEDLEEGEEYDDIDFPALLLENKGKVVELLVWNIKAQEKRLVELVPNDDWGGAGLLGVTIKLDDYGGADERLIRVLEVEDGSPASVAGLIPMKDYLLGTTFTAFGSSQILASVLNDNLDQVVEIYVYNSDSDVVRVVPLMPTFSWGGRGMLGAEVGTGYLHRLPNSCRDTIGQSIERKVRVMKKKRAPVDTENGADDDDSSSDQIIEMEPHLEMEVEKDGDNRPVNPEEVTRQPHELGSNEKVNMTEPAAASRNEPQTSAESTSSLEGKIPIQSISSDSAAEPSTGPVSTAPETQSTEALAQAAESTAEPQQTSSPPDDAAELFSRPPPSSAEAPNHQQRSSQTGTSFASSYLPAPPKMTY